MDLDFTPLIESRQYLLEGLELTIVLSLATVAASLALAMVLAVHRSSHAKGHESQIIDYHWTGFDRDLLLHDDELFADVNEGDLLVGDGRKIDLHLLVVT